MDFDPRDYDSRDQARSPDRDTESRDRAFDAREPHRISRLFGSRT